MAWCSGKSTGTTLPLMDSYKVISLKASFIFTFSILTGLYEYDSTMPSAPPLDQMEQVTGYETISFSAGMSDK
jgi:hypothetical protein